MAKTKVAKTKAVRKLTSQFAKGGKGPAGRLTKSQKLDSDKEYFLNKGRKELINMYNKAYEKANKLPTPLKQFAKIPVTARLALYPLEGLIRDNISLAKAYNKAKERDDKEKETKKKKRISKNKKAVQKRL
jgi:uncharacterized protein (DUF885 family)